MCGMYDLTYEFIYLPGKTGCTCIPFDFDSSTDVDIFDVVAGLEHLSEGNEIYNEKCSARSKNKIDFVDLLILISKIVTNSFVI